MATATKAHRQPVRLHGERPKVQRALWSAVSSIKAVRVNESRDFEKLQYVKPDREVVKSFAYAAFVTRSRAPILTVDVDDDLDHDRINDLGLRPNLVGINRDNGHHQMIWILASMVYGSFGHPRRFYNAIGRALDRQVGGDIHFSRTLARNPFHQGQYEWHGQHTLPVELGMFHDVLAADPGGSRTAGTRESSAYERLLTPDLKRDDSGDYMRYTYLYDSARFAGYNLRRRNGRVDVHELLDILAPLNLQFESIDRRGPRDGKTLERIAISVARFCNGDMIERLGAGFGRYTRAQLVAGGITQGNRNRESGLLDEIRPKANMTRSVKSIDRAELIRVLHATGELTIAEVAAEVGVSKRTVYRALATSSEQLFVPDQLTNTTDIA